MSACGQPMVGVMPESKVSFCLTIRKVAIEVGMLMLLLYSCSSATRGRRPVSWSVYPLADSGKRVDRPPSRNVFAL